MGQVRMVVRGNKSHNKWLSKSEEKSNVDFF